jgi:hypothetical protein
MEKEIARVEQIAVTMLDTDDGERKFALRYFMSPDDKEGVLAIQHLLTKKTLTDLGSVIQQALKYLEKS